LVVWELGWGKNDALCPGREDDAGICGRRYLIDMTMWKL